MPDRANGSRGPRRRKPLAELTAKWHVDEQRWVAGFRDGVMTRYGDVVSDVVVFGSKARGDWNGDSDIDVLVLVKDDALHMKHAIQWMGHALAVPSYAVPCIIVRSEADWARKGAIGSLFHREVQYDGVSVL